jgi:hypothetical protein
VCLAEVVTHRRNYDTWLPDDGYFVSERTATMDMSKNSASSRAITIQAMLQKVRDHTYMPMWSLKQKGMQGRIADDQELIAKANEKWLWFRDCALETAEYLEGIGIHKQDANRVLENFVWVTQVVTSTNWPNFFALRCHEAAFPPFRKLARMAYLQYRKSIPVQLDYGQWHLPFVPLAEQLNVVHHVGPALRMNHHEFPIEIKRSAARCGWISYENHDRDGSDDAVLRTYARFFAEPPVHASPIEHQCTPMHTAVSAARPELRSNLRGWVQARKLVANEQTLEFNPSDDVIATWDDVRDYL